MSRVIALIANDLEGILNFRKELILELIKDNHKVHLLSPAGSESSRNSIDSIENLHLHEIYLDRASMNLIGELRTAFCIFLRLRTIRPNIVYSSTIKPNIYGMLSAYILRIKTRVMLVNGLGTLFRTNRIKNVKSIIVKNLFKLSLKASTKIIFHNKDDKKYLKHENFLSKSKSVFVVNGSGVNTDVFQFTENNCSNKPVSFLMISRLLTSKGIQEYYDACRKLFEESWSFNAVLIGDIDRGPDAINNTLLELLRSSKFIDYKGHSNSVKKHLQNCNVFVLPSYHEGMPKSCLEALSSGRPIITTDSPGCRDVVINNSTGLMIPSKSYIDLADAMLRFIQNPNLLLEMSKNARKQAVEKYDIKIINNQYKNIIIS